jgi:hypothetical protein
MMQAEAVVVKEMAAQAEQIQQEKAAKTAESKKRKRALLDQLIERKVRHRCEIKSLSTPCRMKLLVNVHQLQFA